METKILHASAELVKKLKIVALMQDITLQQATNNAITKFIKENDIDGKICESALLPIRPERE